MAIRDLDDPKPKSPEVPVDIIPDDYLFLDGRIKDLFDRVLLRKKAQWDPATRTRQPMSKNVAELVPGVEIDKAWAIIEEDSLAHYKSGNIECWIVRFGSEKYACQIFKDGVSIDSIAKREFDALAKYLFETYPATGETVEMPPIVKRGRPISKAA